MHLSLRRSLLASGLLAAALGASTSTASAAVKAIAANPLTVWVDQFGQLQSVRAGESSGIFFAPGSQTGDAGFFLAFPAPAVPTALGNQTYGFGGSAGPSLSGTANGLQSYVAVDQSDPAGAGTATDPYRLVTRYRVPRPGTPVQSIAEVTQITTYVNGAQTIGVHWDVKNVSGAPLRFKALAAADFYFEGSDRGTGVFTQGPPRFIGGTNADTGRSGGFVETTGAGALPWSHYQALRYAGGDPLAIWGRVENAAATVAPVFDDTVLGDPDDNAGAVEWDQALTTPLAINATQGYDLTIRTSLPAALQFDQTNAGAPQGVPITFTATAKDTADVPFAGKPLRYTITGANPLSATATIDAAGQARLVDPGTNAGADTLVAYVDLNANGTREANEPQGSTLATFVDKTPPSCKVAVRGDRPGGGGAGRPLVITVTCDSPATVTSVTTLTARAKTLIRLPRKRSVALAAKATPKKPTRRYRTRKVVLKLPKGLVTVAPGAAAQIGIKIPKALARKYAGQKVVATSVVTAVDTAGNSSTVTSTRTLSLAKVKKAPVRR